MHVYTDASCVCVRLIMVSIPYLKADDRIFMVYGTPIRTCTSRHPMTPESINGILCEEYIMDRATNRWDGPAYLSYTSRTGRLRSYVNWPHACSNLSPAALSEAGFFHSGKRRQAFSYSMILLNCIRYTTLFNLTFTGRGDESVCFHCGGGLRFWQRTDDPWKEHALWFPYCVFLRYVKGTEFVRQCENSQPAITSTTDSNDGKQCTLM